MAIEPYRRQIAPARTVAGAPMASTDAFGGSLGESIERAGATMQAVADRRRRAEEEQAESAAMMDAARRYEEANADIERRRMEAREQAEADGAGHTDAMLATFDQVQTELLDATTHEKARNWLELQLIRRRGAIDVQESSWAAGRRVGKMVGDYEMARDAARADLFTNPSMDNLAATITAYDELAAGLNVPADVREQLRAEIGPLFGKSYAQGLAERDPYTLRGQIDAGELSDIVDPDDLAVLRNRADVEIRGREAARRAEIRAAEAAARERARDQREAARDYVTDINMALNAGVPVPDETVRRAVNLSAQIGNQGQALAIATMHTKAVVNREFGLKSPVEIQRAEFDLSQKISADGQNADPMDIAARDQLRTLRDTQAAEMKKDPWGWLARYGSAPAPIDPEDPESFAARAAEAAKLSRQYGVNVPPLTSTEADAFATALETGTPGQKMQVASQLAQFGGRAVAQAGGQVAERDPLAGHAIGLAALGRSHAATQVFAGAEYRKANPGIAPKAEVDERYEDLVGDAFRFMPHMRDHVKEAGTNIYAARWGAHGGTEWRRQSFDAGVRMALGAVRGADGDERGGLGKWRSNNVVVLPTGMSQREFERAVNDITDEDLKRVPEQRPVGDQGQDLPAHTVRRGRFYSVGDGEYYVVLPGAAAPLRAASGDVFRLRVRGQR